MLTDAARMISEVTRSHITRGSFSSCTTRYESSNTPTTTSSCASSMPTLNANRWATRPSLPSRSRNALA